MSGFADLVNKAQPALVGGGVSASGSAGRTWSWTFTDIVDDNGDPIDMATDVVGECKIVDAPGGNVILWLDYTGTLGQFTVNAAPSFTTDLFDDGDRSRGRICYWYLTLVWSDYSVQAWMVDNSPFAIRRGA